MIGTRTMEDFKVGDVWANTRGDRWLITGFKPRSPKYPLTGRKMNMRGEFGKQAFKLTLNGWETRVEHDESLIGEATVKRLEISTADSVELQGLLETTADANRPAWMRRLLRQLYDAQSV